jgi:hypothetical protein
MPSKNQSTAKSNLSKLTSFSVAASLSALIGINAPQVNALSVEDMLSTSFAQLSAQEGLSTQDLVDGMIQNMAQDGVIRIPLKKERTGFMSQMYAQASAESWGTELGPDEVRLSQAGTYDLNDPIQLA